MITVTNPRKNHGPKFLIAIILFVVLSFGAYYIKYPDFMKDADISSSSDYNENDLFALMNKNQPAGINSKKTYLNGIGFADMMRELQFIRSNVEKLFTEDSVEDTDQWRNFLDKSKESLNNLEHHPNYQELLDKVNDIIDASYDVLDYADEESYVKLNFSRQFLQTLCLEYFDMLKQSFDENGIKYREYTRDGEKYIEYQYKQY